MLWFGHVTVIVQRQFQQLVDFLVLSVPRQSAATGALVGLCRKLWSFRSGSFGFVQFLDKVAVPVSASTGGRAILGSTMDTCSASPGWLLEVFMIST